MLETGYIEQRKINLTKYIHFLHDLRRGSFPSLHIDLADKLAHSFYQIYQLFTCMASFSEVKKIISDNVLQAKPNSQNKATI